MTEKITIPSYMIPLCVSAVVGFGSYTAAVADAANLKLDVADLKKTVIAVSEKAVATGTVAEVNSAKIDAIVDSLKEQKDIQSATQKSIENLVQALLAKK